ncbi:beta-galactosidase [Pedobacter frigiditerrae]|uniref:Beta-galactosidase n=1 Tax=Pedobacter frigiditerrae TaxID=2530452 RepID=A0A4V2MI15_9SPHI|nr:sugar-binding domain-containing protein [Pedobacter frigiditerrae]TCC88606.1 beta-galactosidase [Pedobacter frigiditerrae]
MENIRSIFFTFFTFATLLCQAQQNRWKPVEGKIQTPWAKDIDPDHTLPEYPRPQMVRPTWLNLNGLWEYSINAKNDDQPKKFQGRILVPFAIESALSGVGKTVGTDSLLWYKTSFTIPENMQGKNILLHFGAVDWQTRLYINDEKAGEHEGGYDPFVFNITPYLKKGQQEIVLSVFDPTDEGYQARGKQVKNPKGIWYTPVTGIWQTVWIEAVDSSYIAATRHIPDIDQEFVKIKTIVKNALPHDKVEVIALDGKTEIAKQIVSAGIEADLQINNPKLWSTDHPFLYHLKVRLIRNHKVIDEVTSYFAMRKSSLKKGLDGILRMQLNNKFVFQYGPLDQGWWPDGLYTAPTDQALKFDIEKTKEMGFNMIRKHVKVEPARWYHYCDSIGLLVWQDMPSGDNGNKWESRPGIIGKATFKDRSPASEKGFKTEWNAIIDALYNFPCINVWTPFNEAWGQFNTKEITNWTKQKDPSRLVNSASGGNFTLDGDMIDLHNYPEPAMPDPEIYGSKRALVLGEFGGLGLPLDGHTWQQGKNWGYKTFTNADEMLKNYSLFIEQLKSLIEKGLSAAVYTQTTDVEIEVNGLMTYDRKVLKMQPSKLRAIHHQLWDKGKSFNHNLD